jgi:hypothetical protein
MQLFATSRTPRFSPKGPVFGPWPPRSPYSNLLFFLVFAFQLRIWRKSAAFLKTVSSHLFLDFPTDLLPPKYPTTTFWEYENHPSLLCVQPTVVFSCKNVDSATSTHKMWVSYLCLTLHAPLAWVGPNIFPRIFLSKKSTVVEAFWETVHVYLRVRQCCWWEFYNGITRNLQLVSRHFIRSISSLNSTPYFLKFLSLRRPACSSNLLLIARRCR